VNFDRGFLYHYSVILVVLHEESHVLSKTWSQMTHKTAEKAISGDVLAGSVVLSGHCIHQTWPLILICGVFQG